MRMSDWSSDVGSSDLIAEFRNVSHDDAARDEDELLGLLEGDGVLIHSRRLAAILGAACSLSPDDPGIQQDPIMSRRFLDTFLKIPAGTIHARSEEHTSALQSLMRNSYAVFCLKKK